MQSMLVRVSSKTLATVGEQRGLYQIANQQIELRWGWLSFQLRPIDLYVLHSELSTRLNEFDIEQDEDYILTINEQMIYLSRTDLSLFNAMLSEGVEKLPSFIVRWKEVQLSLLPYRPERLGRQVTNRSFVARHHN